jgi:UDP-N-acetylmuramoylalanine--D-glutamate ligase
MLRDHEFREYRGRRVTIFGLGSFGGGVGAARFLAERGARVTITDRRTAEQLTESIAALAGVPIERWRLGEHVAADFATAELIVVNPAIRRDHPLLAVAQDAGVPLTSELNLCWQHLRAPILAVTGSNGKSTTTAMLHNILSQTGRRCWLGGNVGRSLLPHVDEITTEDRVVLELSSFQLTDLDRLHVSPVVGVVTNFSPNHLDWHDTLEHYRRAKQTIGRWQRPEDFSVLNADDPEVASWPTGGRRVLFGLIDRGGPGLFLAGESAVWRDDAGDEQRFPLPTWVTLPGRHNLANALGAAAAALAYGVSLQAVERGLRTYQALPHRLELVATTAGRRFYNDSLATTPESTLVALEAFNGPILLLAGGYDKRVDLTAMGTAIARRTKGVALMGQTAARLAEILAATPDRVTEASAPLPDFETAFRWVVERSVPGDVILLSPGCASYDWFRNFADRGAQFSALARGWHAS